MRLARPRRACMRVALGIGIAVLLVAGSSFVAAGGVGARTSHAAGSTPTKATPAGLLTDLADLDGGLDRLISDWKAGKVGGVKSAEHARFVARVKALGREKLAIVQTYFDGPTYGPVAWSEVFSTLDCLDSRLNLALGYDFTSSANRKLIPGFIEAGIKCKGKLEADLRKPGGSGKATPEALLTSLDDLDGGLNKLESDWKAGKIGGDRAAEHAKFIARVKALEGEKLAIVRTYFDGPTYGPVAWSEVFSTLDCLDSRLSLALGYDLTRGANRALIPGFLKAGIKCKQKLEDHLPSVLPPEPVLTPIEALFNQATFTTTYTEYATGDDLSYQWAVAIPADPKCATGFKGSSSEPEEAFWYHADASQGGPCNHGGTASGPRGHPGTVAVVVSNEFWSCAATYQGTEGDSGSPTGDGDTPQPCVKK